MWWCAGWGMGGQVHACANMCWQVWWMWLGSQRCAEVGKVWRYGQEWHVLAGVAGVGRGMWQRYKGLS
jgi:hypothetical protein